MMKKATTQKKRVGSTARKTCAPKNLTAEERYRLIQEAAYLRAEKDSFQGDPCRYWLEAELEVDARIEGGK